MIYIGLDLSLTSTAACIYDGHQYYWFVFPDNYKSHLKGFQHHEAMKHDLNIVPYERDPKKRSYSEGEWYKFQNSLELSKIIVESIQEKLKSISSQISKGGIYNYPKEKLKIGFEGFSYGSKGGSKVDLVVYASNIKNEFVKQFGQGFDTISPNTVKSTLCGKGNANKFFMIEYLQREMGKKDPELKKDPIFKYIKKLETTKMSDIPKPIDDLVDSYGVTKWLKDNYS